MVTANISLKTSTVGVTTDSLGSQNDQDNLELLDLHDHTTGKGVRIPSAGINVNADLEFNNNSATELEGASFTSQVVDSTVANTIFVKNGELYYVDASLNAVQLTSSGAVSLVTSISGQVFIDGGNTRGANLRLGTNDSYSFFFETNNTDRFQIDGSGFMKFISDWGFQPSTNGSTGSLDDVTTSTTSHIQMTGTGSTTITGFANGISGKTLLISNQTGSGLTIKNESASSIAANRIQTGTGNDISIADKASAILIYNSTTTRWSLLTGAATAATLTYPVGNVSANDSDVTFTSSDNRVQICAPTAARTYTLPTTSISAGDTWTFINTSTTSANVITVQSSGLNTISRVFPNGKLVITALVSSPTASADWLVSELSATTTSYTPTVTGAGTATSVSGTYRISKDTAFFTISFTAGTVAATLASISLPTGINIKTSGLTINNNSAADGNIIGQYSQSTNNAFGFILAAPATSTTLVYAGQLPSAAGDPLLPRNGNNIWNNTALTVLQFSIPIS